MGDLIYDQALIGDGKTASCLIGDHLTMLIGDIASPIMHRFGHCLRHLLQDEMCFVTH